MAYHDTVVGSDGSQCIKNSIIIRPLLLIANVFRVSILDKSNLLNPAPFKIVIELLLDSFNYRWLKKEREFSIVDLLSKVTSKSSHDSVLEFGPCV